MLSLGSCEKGVFHYSLNTILWTKLCIVIFMYLGFLMQSTMAPKSHPFSNLMLNQTFWKRCRMPVQTIFLILPCLMEKIQFNQFNLFILKYPDNLQISNLYIFFTFIIPKWTIASIDLWYVECYISCWRIKKIVLLKQR